MPYWNWSVIHLVYYTDQGLKDARNKGVTLEHVLSASVRGVITTKLCFIKKKV